MYQPYLSEEEYLNNGGLIEDDIEKYLISASRHIDSLTFNRIVAKGFENLTDFQREIVKTVCFAPNLFIIIPKHYWAPRPNNQAIKYLQQPRNTQIFRTHPKYPF